MTGKTLSELKVGDHASYSRTITDKMIRAFAEISGDVNPIHLDPEYAKNTKFGHRIAHGALISSLFSTVFGNQLPGEGAIYYRQDSKFVAPVDIGDTITATVEVAEIQADKGRAIFNTIATNQDGKNVCVGQAVIYPRKD